MHTVEEAYRSASELYWIAFLLTGDEELSLRVTMNVLSADEGLEGMSSPGLLALHRPTVIRNALAAKQAEITESARRFALQPSGIVGTLVSRRVDQSISKAQIQEALLAIDLFPRCVLLLTVFEGLPPEEAAILLHSNRDLIERGRITALRDFTRNFVPVARIVPVNQEADRTVTSRGRPKHQILAL